MINTPEILIIEDDPQIRRFLRATFTAEEYRFHEALTAEEGIAQAAARQPDLIVLDLGLPDRDGLEVIHKVREWAQTPIIVLSARGQEKDKIQALDSGADGAAAAGSPAPPRTHSRANVRLNPKTNVMNRPFSFIRVLLSVLAGMTSVAGAHSPPGGSCYDPRCAAFSPERSAAGTACGTVSGMLVHGSGAGYVHLRK